MQAYEWMVADLRAAVEFAPAAWRRAWWVLVPACLAWSLAVSPYRSPAWTGLAVTFSIVAATQLYRIAIRKSPATLVAGVWRLAIVWLLTAVFFAVLGSLLFVVLLSSAYAVASAGMGFDPSQVRTWALAVDDRGRLVLAVVAAVGLSLLAWAMTRVALAPAATVATGRVRVLSSWPVTRRIGWRLLCARVALGIPVAGLAVLALGESRMGGAAMPSGAWMLSALFGLITGGVWLPLNTAFMAYIYDRRANL